MSDSAHRPSYWLLLIGAGAIALAGCNEKRVDHGSASSSPPAAQQRSAVQQTEDRAAAAARRLQEAQANATTDKEKEDAVNQYEADRQAVANGTDSQQNNTGESAPPPN